MILRFQWFLPTIIAFVFFYALYFLDNKYSFEPWAVRKIIHSIGMIMIGIFVIIIGNSLIDILITGGIFLLFLLFFLLPPFDLIEYIFLKAKRPEEKIQETIINVIITSISITILFLIFQKELLYFITGLFVLAIGDAFGEFFGRKYGKHKYQSFLAKIFHFDRYKSLEGSVGVFVGSLIGISLAFILYWNALPVKTIWIIILLMTIISLITTLLEAMSISFIDNVLLPWDAALLLYYLFKWF